MLCIHTSSKLLTFHQNSQNHHSHFPWIMTFSLCFSSVCSRLARLSFCLISADLRPVVTACEANNLLRTTTICNMHAHSCENMHAVRWACGDVIVSPWIRSQLLSVVSGGSRPSCLTMSEAAAAVHLQIRLHYVANVSFYVCTVSPSLVYVFGFIHRSRGSSEKPSCPQRSSSPKQTDLVVKAD